MRTIAVTREVEEWRARNPLLLWMKKNGKGKKGPVQKLMRQAGVNSRKTVYGWLYGYTLPRAKTIARLRPLTGITLDAWVRWFNAKPEGELQACNTDSPSTLGSGEN